MKKYLPYVFPVIAILIVVFLLFRWYRMNDQRDGEISQFGEGVEIENLSDSEAQEVLSGVGDYTTVEMDSTNDEAMGSIRYELDEDKVRFSVMATLPEPEAGQYQVWLREVDGDAVRKAFVLDMSKGGYMGSAGVSADVLPFEVVVSKELNPDNELEEELLSATLTAEEMVEAAE